MADELEVEAVHKQRTARWQKAELGVSLNRSGNYKGVKFTATYSKLS